MADKVNPANLLALAVKEADEKKADIDKALTKRVEKLILDVKKELEAALNDASKIYNSIPIEHRNLVWAEPAYEVVLHSLGLQVKESKPRKPRKPRSNSTITDEEVLKFIGDEEKTTGGIQSNFEWSPTTTSKRLKALESSKKIKSRAEGTKKLWKTV